jgi:hypothetical protein
LKEGGRDSATGQQRQAHSWLARDGGSSGVACATDWGGGY